MLVVEFPGYGLCPGKPSEARFTSSSSDRSPRVQTNATGQDSLDSAADACFRYVREVVFIAVLENKSAKHRCAHVSICINMYQYVSIASWHPGLASGTSGHYRHGQEHGCCSGVVLGSELSFVVVSCELYQQD